jgi:hypothetical protein
MPRCTREFGKAAALGRHLNYDHHILNPRERSLKVEQSRRAAGWPMGKDWW